MGRISREIIMHEIKTCVDEGIESFVIYPYGQRGKMVKKILNEDFGIMETAIVDNELSKTDKNILGLDDLEGIPEGSVLLLASDNEWLWNEIREGLIGKYSGKIVDIAKSKKIPYSPWLLQFTFSEEKLKIDECSEEQRKEIFEKTMVVWEKLGEEEPYWSVLTEDQYRKKNLDEDRIRNFYNSGRDHTLRIGATLIRNGVINDLKEMKNLDIVEIGCGCGRVTWSLAENFRKVVAVDISKGNLEIARKQIKNKNVDFQQISAVEDYNNLPSVDVVYSIIVLQHNCPPVIEYMLDAMFGRLKGNGVAIFQVPTYKKGYTFEYEKYVKEIMGKEMEMHLLPQKRIFEIAYKNHCIPMEVYPSNSTGSADNSTIFIFQKQNGMDSF